MSRTCLKVMDGKIMKRKPILACDPCHSGKITTATKKTDKNQNSVDSAWLVVLCMLELLLKTKGW